MGLKAWITKRGHTGKNTEQAQGIESQRTETERPKVQFMKRET
jgi:hypothetical protein